MQLYLEVRHLGREVLGQLGDDGARKRDGLGPRVLGESLVQDAFVGPVLVEDDQFLTLLGDDASVSFANRAPVIGVDSEALEQDPASL